jgi:hypothetical protein
VLESRAVEVLETELPTIVIQLRVDRIRSPKSLEQLADSIGNCGDSAILQGC